MLSLSGFVLVLGIVVDDAIIVGENIYRHQEEHGDGLRGSIEGRIRTKPMGVLDRVAVGRARPRCVPVAATGNTPSMARREAFGGS